HHAAIVRDQHHQHQERRSQKTSYEPRIWRAGIVAPIGTISTTGGTGISRLIAPAMAPISAPALILLAVTSANTAADTSGRGKRWRKTAASPVPVTMPILAHVYCTAAIIGN